MIRITSTSIACILSVIGCIALFISVMYVFKIVSEIVFILLEVYYQSICAVVMVKHVTNSRCLQEKS